MRAFIVLFLAVVLVSCKDLEITKVSYSTVTMMGRTVTAVSQDSVVVTFNGRGEPTYFARETNEGEWEGVLNALLEVDLKKIADLEAPSNKRSTDASPFADFKIFTKDSTYQSAGFDHKNPNEVLVPLMDEFNEILETNKK